MNKTIEMLNKVMDDVRAVGKTGTNTSQNYKFRGIDAVVNAVAPALRKHGGIIIPELISADYSEAPSKSGGINQIARLLVRYEVRSVDGDPISGVVAAEAFDSGDKATAKAMSVAFRTFLIQILCLPTDEPDPDEQSYETAPKAAKLTDQQWLGKARLAATLDELKSIYGEAQKSGASEMTLVEIKKLGGQ